MRLASRLSVLAMLALAGCRGSCPAPGHVGPEAIAGCAGIPVRELHPAELCLGPDAMISVEPPPGTVNVAKELPTCIADADGRVYVPLGYVIGEAAEAGLRACTREERELIAIGASTGALTDCVP